MKTLGTHHRLMIWLVAPALVLGLSACGSRPQETASPSSPVASGAPSPGEVVTLGSSPEAGQLSGGAPPLPGRKDYPGNMGEGVDLDTVVRELPRTRGENGALKLKTGQSVQWVVVRKVDVEGAFVIAEGGSRVPVRVAVGDRAADAAFIVGRQGVREILLIQGNSEVPYTWSEAERAWIGGAPKPMGGVEAPRPGEGSSSPGL